MDICYRAWWKSVVEKRGLPDGRRCHRVVGGSGGGGGRCTYPPGVFGWKHLVLERPVGKATERQLRCELDEI